MGSLSGFSKLRTPDRKFKSERPSHRIKSPIPNEHLWRDLEDAGFTVVPYNDGHMLRIDDRLDIYPRSLKYRYTHSRNTPFRTVTEILKKNETTLQAIKRVLSLAPDILLPRQQRRKDTSPVISAGLLRATKRYRKSI